MRYRVKGLPRRCEKAMEDPITVTPASRSFINSIVSNIDTGEGVWYHFPCVTGDRGGYGSNALGEILMARAKMISEQGMVHLGLAQKASAISRRLPIVGSFASRQAGMSAYGFLVRSM